MRFPYSVINRFSNGLTSILDNDNNALFTLGHIDFQPSIEKENKCPDGFEKRALNPVKKCKEKFRLEDNGTLVLEYDSPKLRNLTFDTNEYCIAINIDANHKYHHFPEICQPVIDESGHMK